MATELGDWYDPDTASPEDRAVVESLRERITVGQLDPAEVAQRYVELVEADETELVNLVPPDLMERLARR